MSSKPFTQYLLEKYSAEFERATQHPFLVEAGKGTIDQEVLVSWLRQDYLYAFVGYIKFASLLLSRLPLPTSPPGSGASKREQTIYNAVPVLTFSLANVKRETDFFVETARAHGLDLFENGILPQSEDADGAGLLGPYSSVTRAYVDFLWATAAGGSFEDGLVLLWAMEKAYFTAWTFAKKHLPATEPQDEKQHALRKFVDNWTCEEFVGFVQDCTDSVDGLEIDPESPVGKAAEEVFKRTIWLEQRFWPSV